jgi:hypothetical protein
MAGITVIVSDQAGHPAHGAVEHACAQALRLAPCIEHHERCAEGRVSIHAVAPAHLGFSADTAR